MAKARLEEFYKTEIRSQLQKDLGLKNVMEVPKVSKIVVNVGVKDAVKDSKVLKDVVDGTDELGVLLMGNKKGAYWYGSHLSIHEAKKIANYNNATSLQVAAGVLSGMIWAIENPERGIIEPEDMDHEYILSLASPYLGKVGGYYTDWTPLQNKENSNNKHIDHSDPWQFINIRINEAG